MKTSEYSYRKSGKSVSISEESFAFAGDRYTDRLRQSEMAQRFAALSQTPATTGQKNLVLRMAAVVLSLIGLG